MRLVGGNLGLARQMISAVRQALDAGDLPYAEELLEHAAYQVSADDQTYIANELRLTMQLGNATLLQQRGKFEDAQAIAESAVEFANERLEPGIQPARAQLRLFYVWESRGRYRAAEEACFDLADRLSEVPNSAPMRLLCLTRALACAVKNAGRQERATSQGGELALAIDARDGRDILAWFYYWCALAQIRQNQRKEAVWLLSIADQLASPLGQPTWRWRIVMQVAKGNLWLITPGREDEGRDEVRAAREEAESRGFSYLVQAIDGVFKHLDPEAE